jgi:type II secretory pathway pseudopilin PulG
MADPMPARARRPYQSGFSLFELGIVLLIISIAFTQAIKILPAAVNKRQAEETQFKLKAIQDALQTYRLTYGRIPCPGDLTLLTTDANFAVEAANPASCTGGTPVSNRTGGGATFSSQGIAPVRTLRLPDDYAFDGWGRRIVYTVQTAMTGNNAFSVYTVAVPATGSLTIKDVNANTIISGKAMYTLLSAGPNGHGAYPRAGGSTTINSGSINANELINCACVSATGVPNANSSAIFIQNTATRDSTAAGGTNDFDDFVVYATRSDMRSASE